MLRSLKARTPLMLGAAFAVLTLAGCGSGNAPAAGATDAAQRVYVAPGQYDEFYLFTSGGFSGQLGVYGLPSGRLLKVLPVFSQNPENAYGYSEETKAMLNTSYGFIPWDDSHHPEFSMTDGVPDGRWIFINGNNTPRVARIDLTDFVTTEIIEIPHSAGNHASPFVTSNTEYSVAATRFSVPTPQADVPIASYKENFRGLLTFIKVDSASGMMDIAFQILMPGYNYDLSHSGKGPSREWSFFTSYNVEEANTLLEVNASQRDKDYIAAVHWTVAEQCVADGKAKKVPARYAHNVMSHETNAATTEWKTSTNFLDAKDCPGVVYYLPTPKSPHGVDVDPSGEFIVGGGKLASVIPVHSFSKMIKAIEDKAFEGEVDGVPVLKYEAIVAGEVQDPGLGPLHTEFDGAGQRLHLDVPDLRNHQVVAHRLHGHRQGPDLLLDRPPLDPRRRHPQAVGQVRGRAEQDHQGPLPPDRPGADPVGAALRHHRREDGSALDFPTIGEPHYAQAIPASMLVDKQIRTYDLAENKDPYAALSEAATGVTRNGRVVHVKMTSIRSHFMPDNIEGVQVGDSVYFHVTNLEQDWDVPHGFAITGLNNSELLIMPGETRTIVWMPEKVGVFPFYCTDFCSALHQEMSGWVRVSPRGSSVPLMANKPTK